MAAAAFKLWHLGMGLGPVLEHHNVFQWDLATWCSTWISVWLCPKWPMQQCARFPEIVQNFREHQMLWSLCSLVFLALILNSPIQTSLSVGPKLQVSLSSHEKCGEFWKTRASLVYGDTPLPLENGDVKFPSGTLYRSTNPMKPELGSNLMFMLMLMLTLLLTLSMF